MNIYYGEDNYRTFDEHQRSNMECQVSEIMHNVTIASYILHKLSVITAQKQENRKPLQADLTPVYQLTVSSGVLSAAVEQGI